MDRPGCPVTKHVTHILNKWNTKNRTETLDRNSSPFRSNCYPKPSKVRPCYCDGVRMAYQYYK
jgi:hypothetical protein